MVWQSPSNHNTASPDGSNNGGGNPQQQHGHGNGGGPIGAEYTLQGVMRFLQTEWHKHERDRNRWEIERAEMKARIAKLEGENRAEKRLHQVHLARIKILERALKKERAERAMGEGRNADDVIKDETAQAEKDKARVAEKLKRLDETSSVYKAEAARNKSRAYLEKCLQEITYLLKPPSHPAPAQQPQPQQQVMSAEAMSHQQQAQFALIQQQQAQQHANLQQHLQHPSPSPNHQPPPPPSQSNRETAQSHPMRSQGGAPSHMPNASPYLDDRPQAAQQHIPSGDAGEKTQAGYSSIKHEYGKKETNPFSAAAGIEVAMRRRETQETADDAGWDFDDKIGSSSDTDSVSSSEELNEYGNHSGRNNIDSHRRKSLSKRRSIVGQDFSVGSTKPDSNFKVKFALRGHLDVVRAVVFTGGGTVNEPEICTAGDDGVLKRWYIPGSYGLSMSGSLDVDVTSHFTHRGHAGIVTCLAACPASNGDGVGGSGWVFSGGQDSTVKVWEAGRVDPVATLVGHTDAVWAVCVLPSASAILGSPDERVLLASGSADGTVKIWSVTSPPAPPRRPSSSASNSSTGSLRSFSTFNNNPATSAFDYSLISTIKRPTNAEKPDVIASPTCIIPMSVTGDTFIVSYNDASVIIYDTASCEEVVSMASQETYDGTPATGVSSVVATTMSLESGAEPGKEEDILVAGATGQAGGVGGVVISGHEDQYVRIFDANSGQCTYTMLAHPAAISSLALSPDGRELVSAGHDASLRFWSMEKRSCTQDLTPHRLMRGEGVCTVVWSADGKWVVSGGGDGVVKVYCR